MDNWWSICVSNDRQLYAQPTEDGEILVCRLIDDEEVHRIPATGEDVWVTRFGRHGQHLSAIYQANPKKLVVWRLEDCLPVLEFSDPGLHYWDFNLDGQVAVVLKNELLVFRLGDSEAKQTIEIAAAEEKAACRFMASHPTQKLIAIGLDIQNPSSAENAKTSAEAKNAELSGRLLIVNLETEEIQSLPVPELIGTVAWVGDGNLLAVAYNSGTCELRDLTQPEATLGHFHGHTARVTTMRASADERTLMTYAWDGSVRLWDIDSQQQLTRINGRNVITVSNTEFTDRLALWQDKIPQLWEVHRGQVFRNESLNTRRIKSDNSGVVMHPKVNHFAILATKAGLEFWDTARAVRVGELSRPNSTGLAVVDGGQTLLTCGPLGIERWPIRCELTHIASLTVGPPALVEPEIRRNTAFHDANTWATFERAGRAKIHGRDGEHEIQHRNLSSFQFSPDGKLLATHAWHGLAIKIWNVSTGQLVAELLPDSVSPRGAFTPDGNFFVANTRNQRFVFRTADWTPLHQLNRAVPDGWAGTVVTAHDNRTAMLNHSRHRLELFDLIKGQTIVVLEPSKIIPRTAGCFSPDDSSLLTFHDDGLEIWDLA